MKFSRKQLLSTAAAMPLIVGMSVGVAITGVMSVAVSDVAVAASDGCGACGASACGACNPCNPCAAKNPCAASACGACNPCAASACGASNPCNPCAAKNPCAASACGACNPCSASAGGACGPCGAASTNVSQECVVPRLQQASACNPCAAKNPCGASACGACGASACGACAASACGASNPCNPCAAKNPCAASACGASACSASACGASNPCAASNPCGASACGPCGAGGGGAELTNAEAAAAYDCLYSEMKEAYADTGVPATRNWRAWATQFSSVPYVSATHGGRYVMNYSNTQGASTYAKYEELTEMPKSSVLIKDSFSVNANGTMSVGPLFMMEKMGEGFNAETDDWRYYMFMPDGSLFGVTGGQNSAGMGFCSQCHVAMADTDSLWFLPEEYRVSN